MKKQGGSADWERDRDLKSHIRPFLERAPWVVRITEFKDKPVPVLVVKERLLPEKGVNNEVSQRKSILKNRGLLYGQALRRCLPIIRTIVSKVSNDLGVQLDLHRFLGNGSITFRGNLPLDEEAGAKLSLLFKLQERISDMDRVELIAWRVERFSREEALYWLTRITQYGDFVNRWALAGMRIMLGGQPGDKFVLEMLEKLRR